MEEVFGSSWFPVRGGDFPVGEIGRSLRSTGNELTPQISSVFEVNSKARHALQCGNAFRLSDRIRQRIMQMEKNGINKEGELSANQNYNTEVRRRLSMQPNMYLHLQYKNRRRRRRRL
ncbi:PREDICTED: uncharacterized protein LOC104818407 isoform X2 [Tarenaya hassleriana]|uniref:uncharacterized protein LOC104818407 isoform X2 n=1 Tax=Tarenaya hassleriana TaxID=28532 RepID=UPI00053C996B|nr:PREDICTED: uncharacterized protein LOC104818407 isoform X2 [Tarenaya hassleriana]